jgi:hypothetical protein
MQRRMIMKKYNVGLASLLLFFATGAAIGMEKNKNLTLHIQNDTNRTILVGVWYTNGTEGVVTLEKGYQNRQTMGHKKVKSMGMSYSGKGLVDQALKIDLKGAEDALSGYTETLFDAINTYYTMNYTNKPVLAIMKVMETRKADGGLGLIIYEIDWINKDTNETVTTLVNAMLSPQGKRVFSITRK